MCDAGVALFFFFFFHNTDANNDKMKLTLCALKESSLGQSSIVVAENRLPISPLAGFGFVL